MQDVMLYTTCELAFRVPPSKEQFSEVSYRVS